MALVYFDSSAFVKLVVDEEGSDLAATLWDGCDAAVASRLAYPEVRAALGAAGRAGRFNRRGHDQAVRSWEEFWVACRPVELSPQVTFDAGELADEHGLRGADAVHLASALAIGTQDLVVATWDARLLAASLAAGLQVVPAG